MTEPTSLRGRVLAIGLTGLILLIGYSQLSAQDSHVLKPMSQSDSGLVFEIPTWGKTVIITVPKGFAATFREGPDFDVCYFRPTDQKRKALLGVYFGMAPDTHWPEDATKISRQVNGRSATWRSWRAIREGSTTFYRETLVSDFFFDDKVTLVHIFISAADEEEANQLADSVSSLKQKSAHQ